MLHELNFYTCLPFRTKRTVRRCLDELEASAGEGREEINRVQELRKVKEFDLPGMIDLATKLNLEAEQFWSDLEWLATSYKRRDEIARLQDRKPQPDHPYESYT